MTERPPYRLPRDVVPEHYELVIEPDLPGATFVGAAGIDLRVLAATSDIVLNANELDINRAALVMADGRNVVPEVIYRPGEQQLCLRLPTPLLPGNCRLDLRFTGKLNELLRGFYRSKFKSPSGKEQWVASTQFESTDARRAFPCWDEPDFKATFGVTLVADDGLTALSNAREVSSELVGNGKRRTRFAKTIKMSTYLVAFIVGPFELTSPRVVDGVPMRIAYVPGRGALTALAERAAAHALSFLRNYFSMPYPADKLDHIAIPDFASGAMENVGLVTYRETALLVAEDSAQVERQRVVSTVAHETAHMWFGDLVTMRWWEGIWLNEAFATFMETLATDQFEPRWQIWDNFGVDRAAALATDGLRASRAIEHPVGRPEEADDMFDVITYDKGASVLRMIERYLGDETFRRGLNLYLDTHRFSNTDVTDLWDALESASGQPIRAAMSTWVDQPGHPLVSASLTGPFELTLSQRRFLLDGGAPDAEQTWAVPVSLRYGTAEGGVEHDQLLLQDVSTTVPLKAVPTWLVVNEEAWGVYRTYYSEDLRGRLLSSHTGLSNRERLSLVSDMWATTVAGLVSLPSSLEVWWTLRDDRDPDVWWAISSGLGLLDLISHEEDRQRLHSFVVALAGGLFDDLGWGPAIHPQGARGQGQRLGGNGASGESPQQARLRARLVTLLGTLGSDDAVRTEARKRLALADAGEAPLPPDLATAVAQVVASAGGDEEWSVLYCHYKDAATPQDEVRYLQSLGGFSNGALLSRSIELTFSGEVRNQDAPYLLMSILGKREGSVLAWEAIEAHWEEMQRRWPANSIHRMLEALPGLAGTSHAAADRALAWLDAHPLPRGELKLRQARERLKVNLAFRERIAPLLRAALEDALNQRER
ncbi:MAG TPA: M1 family metallopeptidase [Acidimicrobiales bacterium]|nr:M1 family metallopeptidase [Acidimicrobiales bacterium]